MTKYSMYLLIPGILFILTLISWGLKDRVEWFYFLYFCIYKGQIGYPEGDTHLFVNRVMKISLKDFFFIKAAIFFTFHPICFLFVIP